MYFKSSLNYKKNNNQVSAQIYEFNMYILRRNNTTVTKFYMIGNKQASSLLYHKFSCK